MTAAEFNLVAQLPGGWIEVKGTLTGEAVALTERLVAAVTADYQLTTSAAAEQLPVEAIACPECGKAASTTTGLAVHRARAHGVDGVTKRDVTRSRPVAARPPSRSTGPWTCEHCPDLTFDTPQGLGRHRRDQHPVAARPDVVTKAGAAPVDKPKTVDEVFGHQPPIAKTPFDPQAIRDQQAAAS